MKKLYFFGIKFNSFQIKDFTKIISKKGLFVFPSGPGLSTIDQNKQYLFALKNADYVFFDSGFFVILINYIKGINVKKFSGYLFIKLFINYLKKKRNLKILSVDPSFSSLKKNYDFFIKIGLKKKNIINYVAPKYNLTKIEDKNLLKIINKYKPNYVLINIGGGVQEILGYNLKKNSKVKTSIICTGAAISFLTGEQAPINNIVDKLYIGWLLRIIYKPNIFIIRYFKAFKLFILVLKTKISEKKS